MLFSLLGVLTLTSACFRRKKAHVEEETIIYVDQKSTTKRVSGPMQPDVAWTDTDLK
ncbi:MAG: hypothetical protein WC707_01725 [Candidatus Babeliaceae bacterium]